ncbi:MAG: hypothetical protein WCK09_19210 [Bacteroidota bacterium]
MKTLNQTRPTATLILTAGLVISVASVFGQPLKVNVKVNSTVGIQQEQPFEVVKGQKSSKMNATGTFIIKAKENSNVLVSMNAPDVLVNKEKQTMPLNMSLAWHNNTPCNENKLRFNTNKTNTFTFSQAGNEKATQDDNRLGYLYLKGTAEVPADSKSPFTGTINLTLEY